LLHTTFQLDICASFSYFPQSIALLFFSMAHVVDFAVPLTGYPLFALLDECYFPQMPYLSFVTRRQAGSVQPRIDTNSHECFTAKRKGHWVTRISWMVAPPGWFLFQLRNLKSHLRNCCLHNVPDKFQIDSRIIVHDAITQTGYLRPWNRRVLVLESGGKLL